MMSSAITNEEKRRLANEQQNAVRNAWREEKARVQNGQGTRNWSVTEQKELIERGSVSGYDGHHMKSVSQYPDQAGNPRNIQFLTEKEHFQGAHQGNYHNMTNGYYDPETQSINEFDGDELIEVPVSDLSERYLDKPSSQLDTARLDYISNNDISPTVTDSNEYGLDTARNEYENNYSIEESSASNGDSSGESEGSGMGR